MTPQEQENLRYLARAMNGLFSRFDPGMAVDPIRSRLIAANLPIDAKGNAIVENDQ